MANTKEIIKQFRAKMREYRLNIKYKGISQNDDDLLDKILIELINCFSTSEEEAKKLSRKALDKEIGKYELKIFNSRLALKDSKFLEENSREKIEEIFNQLIKSHQTNFKGVGQPLRIALTGSKFGPGIYDILLSLDKNEVVKRLKIIK